MRLEPFSLGGSHVRLEPLALEHAAEHQMVQRQRGVEWIADYVVEVMITHSLGIGKAQRVHENHRFQLVGFGEEFFQTQAWVGEVEAIYIGVDFDSAQTEFFYCVLEFLYRQFGVLQRDRTQAHEPIGMSCHHIRDAFVYLAREFCAHAWFGEIKVVVGSRRDDLYVDAHSIHVAQALLDTGQFWSTISHLPDIGLIG